MKTPAFLDRQRPDVPDLVVPGGVTPFYLQGRPVRGRLVRPGVLADVMLTRHDHHAAVTRLAGKALSVVAALASALKFQGSFSLQIKGNGPVSLLVADCTNTGALRFYIRADEEAVTALLSEKPEPSDYDLTGDGYLALTIDQGPETERHQGIVDISGDSLTDMISHYFKTSEQHACWISLHCELTDAGWRTGALILERLADDGGIHIETDDTPEDSWNTATILASTLKASELLDDALPPRELLFRLFHAEGLQIGQPRALAYGCRCSRARLTEILQNFSDDDLDHMMLDDRLITMTCEFCNISFHFQRDDISSEDND